MKHLICSLVIFVLFLLLFSCSHPSFSPNKHSLSASPPPSCISETAKLTVCPSYGTLPLAFIKNEGQAHDRVAYYLKGREGTIYFTKEELVYDLIKLEGESRETERAWKKPEAGTKTAHKYRRLSFTLKPEGARKDVVIKGSNPLPGKVNYLTGNDPKQWHTNILLNREIVYQGLYEGIDLKVYGTNNRMEYDFIVQPGADPQKIRLTVEGIEALDLDSEGNLVIKTPLGALKHLKPLIYQEIDGQRTSVEGSYLVVDNSFGFDIKTYDRNYPLVIDPLTLSFSTYLGGSSFDEGVGTAVDGSGNVLVTGTTWSTDFPTQDAWQTTKSGDCDVFIAKFSASGTLIFSTFLGGIDDDWGAGISADGSGNASVTGSTWSADFPIRNAWQGKKSGDADVFVAKLSASGSLVYSTYLGGGGYDGGAGIDVDGSGNAFVTGSAFSTDFPIRNAWQEEKSGDADVFVTKFSSSGALVYSTFLGGIVDDYGAGISVDGSGNASVTGSTWSADFPIQNAWQKEKSGDADVFVTKFSSSGALVYSTFLGGIVDDYGAGISVDGSGNASVTGSTDSADFPTQNAWQEPFYGGDVFVAKLSTAGSLIYATILGGSSDDRGSGIAVDGSGNAFVTGFTWSADFPTQNAWQEPFYGVNVFVAKLSTAGSLIYSTYLGGSGYDESAGIAVDGSGNAFVTGKTSSTDFPITNAWQETPGGNDYNDDSFIVKLAYIAVPEMNVGQGKIAIADNVGTYRFGSVVVGASKSVTFTIQNSGEAALNLTGSPRVAVSGTSVTDFVVTTQPGSPVGASGSTTFVVTFMPRYRGIKVAKISIVNNDRDENPYNFFVLGTGLSR